MREGVTELGQADRLQDGISCRVQFRIVADFDPRLTHRIDADVRRQPGSPAPR